MLQMMDPASWTFVFVMSCICGVACMVVSARKGYRGGQIFGWLLAGMLFSVFGLIAVVLTPHSSEG